MKYYVEAETRELRKKLEDEILSWPKVTHRKMMGCPCYLAGGKMFAGLVTRGIVITKLTSEEKNELAGIHTVEPFTMGSRTTKKWARLTLEPGEVQKVLPYIRKSYERALES
jgi:hypothetical protein